MSLIRLLLVLTITIGLAGCGPAESDQKSPDAEAENTPATYALSSNTAGSFTIGDTLPDSSGAFTLRKEQRPGQEGPPPQTVYHVSRDGAELMTITPEYDTEAQAYTDQIAEIIVTSERFKTEQNIGPGSTIEDFTAAYPEAKVWYTYVSDRFVLETPQHENMQFLLRAEDFTGEVNTQSEITPLALNNFKKGANIRAVRIY